MITTMLILFVVGYAFIAFEHKTGINKSAIALLMCGILWSIFSLEYPSALPGLTQTTVSDEILRHLGSTCEILVFLIGAMTIVDLIDFHGGFEFITRRITTRRKVRLLWLVALLTRSLLRLPGVEYVYPFLRFAGDQHGVWLWSKAALAGIGLLLFTALGLLAEKPPQACPALTTSIHKPGKV